MPGCDRDGDAEDGAAEAEEGTYSLEFVLKLLLFSLLLRASTYGPVLRSSSAAAS